METPDQLQQEIVSIQARNKKVTLDKEREESTTRKICIALLTYGVIVIFFMIVHIANPWVNALVPTM